MRSSRWRKRLVLTLCAVSMGTLLQWQQSGCLRTWQNNVEVLLRPGEPHAHSRQRLLSVVRTEFPQVSVTAGDANHAPDSGACVHPPQDPGTRVPGLWYAVVRIPVPQAAPCPRFSLTRAQTARYNALVSAWTGGPPHLFNPPPRCRPSGGPSCPQHRRPNPFKVGAVWSQHLPRAHHARARQTS